MSLSTELKKCVASGALSTVKPTIKQRKPKGELPPALRALNQVVTQKNLAKEIRRWIYAAPLDYRPANAEIVAGHILSEARGRVVRFKETPLEALGAAAALTTTIYRQATHENYLLVSQNAQEAFKPLFN